MQRIKEKIIDVICKLFGYIPYTVLEDSLEKKEKIINKLEHDKKVSPVNHITKIDESNEDVILITLREEESAYDFKKYIEKKYRKRTGREPRSLIVVANNVEDIKHLDQIDIDEYIAKYRMED